ncbi:unnamed protein product [Microthlaspi erraticum]|uniref:DUF1204 domain-containing protein n=1 Tax=Microthlaspi erraticum TaxID=1685480 RepID=A0A6D2HLY0_9BRAS|nr:unnamed protein product [Microthlaspi erraticum]
MSARSAKGRADLVEVKERNAELESQVAELKGILALKESGLERSEADLALARLDADSRGAENERLKSKIAELERRSADEAKRTESLWNKVRQAKRETVDIFWPRLKKVKTFLADQDRMNPRVLTLNQAVAVRDSYEALKSRCRRSADWVKKYRVDVEQLEAEIDQEEVVTADELELEFGPLADEVAKLDAGTSCQFVPSEY